jgi:transposase InsO family protein
MVYIDDIIIFSTNFTDHAKHVSKVLSLLNEANLKVNRDKCLFALTEILILGYKISAEGIQVCPKKLVQIETWKTPSTGKEIQKHLGFFNYFRELIPMYSKLVAPLEKLRYVKRFEWKTEYQKIYDQLKEILGSNLILSYPDFDHPFEVATDASDHGIGSVLYQVIDNKTHFVAFHSRALHSGEDGYGATKRELLAVVNALQHFRYYLFGRRFKLFTDHKALTYIHTQKTTNQMINAWFEQLLELDYEIIHRPGILNVLPDALSRLYDTEKPTYTIDAHFLKRKADQMLEEDIVPITERKTLIVQSHLKGHFGAVKVLEDLRNRGYFWLTMKRDVQDEISMCMDCQRFNIGQKGYHPLTTISATLPMDHIAIDLKEFAKAKNGSKYCLVVIDICTRFVWLRCLEDKTEKCVAKALVEILCNFGIPRIIQSDNGKEFVNKVFAYLCELAGIDHRLISSYYPQANGAVENMVKTTSMVVYKRLQGRDADWPLYIPSTQLFVNMSVSTLHGSTPYSLMFARKANEFVDYRDSPQQKTLSGADLEERINYMTSIVFPGISNKAKATQDKYKQSFAKYKRIISETYPPGAVVMVINDLRQSKSEERYTGPFLVKRRTAAGTYILIDGTGEEFERNISKLKLVSRTNSNEAVEEVSTILDERKKSTGEWEYLTRFKFRQDPVWIPATNFNDYTPIRKFLKERYQQRKSSNSENDPVPVLDP